MVTLAKDAQLHDEGAKRPFGYVRSNQAGRTVLRGALAQWSAVQLLVSNKLFNVGLLGSTFLKIICLRVHYSKEGNSSRQQAQHRMPLGC